MLRLIDRYTSLPLCFVRKNALVPIRTARAMCACMQWKLTVRHASRLPASLDRHSRVQDVHAGERTRLRCVPVIAHQPAQHAGARPSAERQGRSCRSVEPRTNEHQRAHESDYFGLSTAAEARPEGTPHEGGEGGIYKLINNFFIYKMGRISI